MSMQQTSKLCTYCGEYRLFQRKGTNHILHLLLSLVTVGLWIPIWALCMIKIGGWHCSKCGG